MSSATASEEEVHPSVLSVLSPTLNPVFPLGRSFPSVQSAMYLADPSDHPQSPNQMASTEDRMSSHEMHGQEQTFILSKGFVLTRHRPKIESQSNTSGKRCGYGRTDLARTRRARCSANRPRVRLVDYQSTRTINHVALRRRSNQEHRGNLIGRNRHIEDLSHIPSGREIGDCEIHRVTIGNRTGV